MPPHTSSARRRPSRAALAAFATSALLLAAAPLLPAAEAPPDPFAGLAFRNIGPAIMGGRIDDFAVVESDPDTFYVAAASSGIWKTVNAGTTFEPVFDDYETSSIGDLAVAPSDPKVVYAGTGEPNNRQSSSWGHGVYRTLDGGKTWVPLGLEKTQHIGRIVVHPTNPDVAYVAALGPLWGPGKERGLYKTTDGGRSWTNTKFVDEDTGFVDVAMDPQSPDTLYAASYQRRRTPSGYNGGGPGSALWKTIDGGRSWTKLTKGLPSEGDVGRIGVAVYRRDPRIVYALVEHAKQGGIYRSDDAGASWRKMSATNPRPSYYSQVHVDPNNDLRIWVLGAPMFYSEDGGKSFKTDRIQKIHGDYHALWIDPADSAGRTMDFVNTVALAQFYEIGLDFETPYNVCGGLQDNGSWCGPSRTRYSQGIGSEDWFRVGGGDGFYVVIDPQDASTIYVESQDGNVRRFDKRTTESRVIRPEPPEGERYRFNWNSPILISPHDSSTVYYGGNRLFGSKDRGETWTLVTPDLSKAIPRDPLEIFGKTSKEFLSRNDGKVHFGTITTLAESPVQAGVLWAGTDDGNLQVSRDGGATWTNVVEKVPGLPKGTYVSRVEASRSGAGVAWVAFDGHRSLDFKPYLYRTEDFGQTWTARAAGIPDGSTLSVVREHPTATNVVLAGTERGLYVSWDRGASWTRLKANLPTVPVDDIQIQPRDNDLVLATHGRGIWILDDMTALLEAPAARSAQGLTLFPVRAAPQERIYNNKGNTGAKVFLADNPPDGALLTYVVAASALPTKMPAAEAAPAAEAGEEATAKEGSDKPKATITVRDAAGKEVRKLDGPAKAGFNRASWDLRHEPPVKPERDAPSFFRPRGAFVPPGIYTVTVKVGEHEASQPVAVAEDPRLQVAPEDRTAWYEAVQQAGGLWKRTDAANKRVAALKKQLGELKSSLAKDARATQELKDGVQALLDRLEPLAKRLDRDEPLGFAGAPLEADPIPLLNRTRGLYFALGSITARPTPQQDALMPRLAAEVDTAVGEVNTILETDVPALNKRVFDSGIGRLDPGKKVE